MCVAPWKTNSGTANAIRVVPTATSVSVSGNTIPSSISIAPTAKESNPNSNAEALS